VDFCRINHIIVVDSLRADDLQTARRLAEDLETLCSVHPNTPTTEYVRIASTVELYELLAECTDTAKRGGMRPLLHIECHGNEHGFQLADGSFADWANLKVPLGNLNGACAVNLMVTVAACTGGALAKVVQLTDRAPFWGMIGPTREMAATELERLYRVFFEILVKERDPDLAVKAMREAAERGAFFLTTAEGLFRAAERFFIEEYQTPERIRRSARRMTATAAKRGIRVEPESEYRRRLITYTPHLFDSYWRNYFFFDQFPDHEERFPVPAFRSSKSEVTPLGPGE
jgi:hypothetical protein